MNKRLLAATSALLGVLALSACVPPSPEPTPVPSPSPTPTPTPAQAQPEAAPPQVVTPSFDNWMDAPQTPGDWRYVAEGGDTLAVFGTGRTPDTVQLILRCERASRRVSIARAGTTSGQVEMLVRTETQDRRLTASPMQSGGAGLIVAQLAASDPLLDAMAFSKGRFAVDVAGTSPVYAPAWPEITRVIEDCRG
ncbi:hypothetical protein [Erythrobacter westpacificensis]